MINLTFLNFFFDKFNPQKRFKLNQKIKNSPGNSITTSHCVGILLSHNLRGVIKWPAAGILLLICLEAKRKMKTLNFIVARKKNQFKKRETFFFLFLLYK